MVLFNNKTKYKLLYTKPLTGSALYKSLAVPLRGFVLKIKYKLLQTRPHTEAALCRSLAANVWGLVLSINQTLMYKKLLQVFVLAVLVFPFVSSASTVTLDSRGCAPGYKFSVTTGISCTAPLRDCESGDLFSTVTGRSCTITNQPSGTPPVVQPPTVVTPVTIPNNPPIKATNPQSYPCNVVCNASA